MDDNAVDDDLEVESDPYETAPERFIDADADAIERSNEAALRPTNLDEFVGQTDVVGPGTMLREAIDNDALSSLLLYGPAGTGKTSLARINANSTESQFSEISAVSSGVADIRKIIEQASDRLAFSGQRTIMFVDEIPQGLGGKVLRRELRDA